LNFKTINISTIDLERKHGKHKNSFSGPLTSAGTFVKGARGP